MSNEYNDVVVDHTYDKKADILIITALYEERKWVQRVFSTEWRDVNREGT